MQRTVQVVDQWAQMSEAVGFSRGRGGGGAIEPKTWGGGFGKEAQLTGP